MLIALASQKERKQRWIIHHVLNFILSEFLPSSIHSSCWMQDAKSGRDIRLVKAHVFSLSYWAEAHLPFSSLSSLLYMYLLFVHDRVTSNPIFSLLSFASLTWYQSAARGRKKYFGVSPKAPPSCSATTPPSAVVALPPRRPLIVVYSSSLCLLGVWYPRRLLVALSPRRLFGVYSSSSPRRLLVVVALPPCIQPPCCLRPAVVVCSAQKSGPAVVALPPCIQPPCGLRPAAVLPAPSSQARRRVRFAPSRRPTCAQQSGTPSRAAVTRDVTLPAPSRQARRRALLP